VTPKEEIDALKRLEPEVYARWLAAQAEQEALQETAEPIHEWFSLSYASYLVLPRTILQSLPVELQRRLVACLDEIGELYPEECGRSYSVNLKCKVGRFVSDPLADYQRGRRRVEPSGRRS
jgi:hypothetical protein